MIAALWVGLGGFVGAILRFMATAFVRRLTPASALPWGTLAVNVVGCLVMGFAVGRVEAGDRLFSAPSTRAFFLVGLHLVLGLASVRAGFAIARWV